MGFFDSVTGVYTIATWPMAAMSDISDSPVKGLAATAVAVGGPLIIFGNPVTAAQNQDFVTLGLMYGVAGVGYWLTQTIVNKVME